MFNVWLRERERERTSERVWLVPDSKCRITQLLLRRVVYMDLLSRVQFTYMTRYAIFFARSASLPPALSLSTAVTHTAILHAVTSPWVLVRYVPVCLSVLCPRELYRYSRCLCCYSYKYIVYRPAARPSFSGSSRIARSLFFNTS